MKQGMIKLSTRYGIGPTFVAVLLTGCAADTDRYPSLAIRDFERVQGTFEVADQEEFDPPAPASANKLAEAVDLLSRAKLEHQSFVAFLPEVEQLLVAANGLGPEDNAWAEGQMAFAQLNTTRSRLAIILSDLDLMFADTSLSYQELDEIEAARESVRVLVAEEDEILTALISEPE